MAPRKQPKRLEESALETIAEYCADTVVYHLENCNAAEVESYIALVKDKICATVPRMLFNDFAMLLLQRISEVREWGIEDWVELHEKFVVEVVVDDRLTKLQYYPKVAYHLVVVLFCNMDRLKNLRYLHLGSGQTEHLSNLTNCNLENLTTFGCHDTCTDEVLQLISERCPNLMTLDIEGSDEITAAGLGFLRRCARLSTVKSEKCHIKANDLITHLLGHDGIKNIAHFIYNLEDLMRFEGGVYPKLTSLRIQHVEITDAALGVIVKSFPSLDTLYFHFAKILGDLGSLRSLSHLTSLGINCSPIPTRHGVEYNIKQVESLLREVGNNYSSFEIFVYNSQLQRVLNVVYETCQNIQYLKVTVQTDNKSHTTTIPPFENVESLDVTSQDSDDNLVRLKFTRLLALKKLRIDTCRADLQSILLDHDHFPCITEIKELNIVLYRSDEIRETIRENNFDVYYDTERIYEWDEVYEMDDF